MIGIGVHRADRTVDGLFAGGKKQGIAERFRHLGAAVNAWQTARIAQERLTGSQYRRGEKTIHLMNDLIRLLNHGQLVVANRYHFGLKGGDICRLANGIRHEPDRQGTGKAFLGNLIFYRRITLHSGDGNNIHIQHR